MSLLLLERRRFALALVVLCAFIAACEQESTRTTETSVEFLFDANVAKSPGAELKRWKSLEAATALVVSIEDASGTIVYDSEQVDLFDFNGDYLSHPLSLLPGSYVLTEFLVINATGDVLYATPLEGSEMAYLVADPLEISFEISKDVVTTVSPEVLSAEGHAPEDFGYASFGLDIVDVLDFLVAVFIYDGTTREIVLTEANIEVADENGQVLYNGSLEARTNKITVPVVLTPYLITITRPGYQQYSHTFTEAELSSYFDSGAEGPLEVLLREQSFAASCEEIFAASGSAGDGEYTIDLDGSGGLEPFIVYCDMSRGGITFLDGSVVQNDYASISAGCPAGFEPFRLQSSTHAFALEDYVLSRTGNDYHYANVFAGPSADCSLGKATVIGYLADSATWVDAMVPSSAFSSLDISGNCNHAGQFDPIPLDEVSGYINRTGSSFTYNSTEVIQTGRAVCSLNDVL